VHEVVVDPSAAIERDRREPDAHRLGEAQAEALVPRGQHGDVGPLESALEVGPFEVPQEDDPLAQPALNHPISIRLLIRAVPYQDQSEVDVPLREHLRRERSG